MIKFDQVSITYSGASSPVLSDVSFEIPEGDLCVVVGRTGTGKSTLLGAMNGLVPHFSGGTLRGNVTVAGRSTATHRPRELADVVGYVGQDPLAGFVTDTVEDELAYGMEQLGLSNDVMRKRVEEALDLMAIAPLRRRALTSLSGGQQQRVAIAAVLATQPQILILDEPTSALDPTAADDVLSAVLNLVLDSSLTVVLAEHRIERVMKHADSMLWVTGEGDAMLGEPSEVLAKANVHPPLRQLADVLEWPLVPLSVRNARRYAKSQGVDPKEIDVTPTPVGEVTVEVQKVTVTYGKTLAVNEVSLQLHRGSVTALMGRNGSGKSSLMWAMTGALDCTGSVMIHGMNTVALGPAKAREHIALVPQNASDLLYLPSVAQEWAKADEQANAASGTTQAINERLGVQLNPEQHPRDLSEGQRLSLVLAIQLAAAPEVMMLDEPTRGLDYTMKVHLKNILKELAAEGKTVFLSTHDVEFVAMTADRTIIMADADVVADGLTREICVASPAFAPQIARVFAPKNLLTPDDVRMGMAR